jgi:hypothetical protein
LRSAKRRSRSVLSLKKAIRILIDSLPRTHHYNLHPSSLDLVNDAKSPHAKASQSRKLIAKRLSFVRVGDDDLEPGLQLSFEIWVHSTNKLRHFLRHPDLGPGIANGFGAQPRSSSKV